MTDCCEHGVPFRWPEECIECEMAEVEPPQINGPADEPGKAS